MLSNLDLLNINYEIATGCVKMTSIDHLYEETKMLPVEDHLSLISSQYLARALQANNSSHSVVTSLSVSETRKKPFNLDFSIVLFRIYQAVFYPPLIMRPPSSPFILKLFPIQNLF